MVKCFLPLIAIPEIESKLEQFFFSFIILSFVPFKYSRTLMIRICLRENEMHMKVKIHFFIV